MNYIKNMIPKVVSHVVVVVFTGITIRLEVSIVEGEPFVRKVSINCYFNCNINHAIIHTIVYILYFSIMILTRTELLTIIF